MELRKSKIWSKQNDLYSMLKASANVWHDQWFNYHLSEKVIVIINLT